MSDPCFFAIEERYTVFVSSMGITQIGWSNNETITWKPFPVKAKGEILYEIGIAPFVEERNPLTKSLSLGTFLSIRTISLSYITGKIGSDSYVDLRTDGRLCALRDTRASSFHFCPTVFVRATYCPFKG
jgi:hypothetical protein